jgi:VWFA-related protein
VTRAVILTTIFLVAHASLGQNAFSRQEAPLPTIRSTSTLVAVPTSVRLPSGEFVKDLDADHFQLFDNGIRQKVSMEEIGNRPIAVVVLMQTGGPGAGQFQNYRNLPKMLDSIIDDSAHEMMLVTFDSRIRQTWHFPARSDGVVYALTHPVGGDDGAAILDAVNYVIDQFQREPGDFRRIVLLLSQSEDDGSRATAEEVLRHLGEGNTSVYTLTFSALKSPPQFWSKNRVAKPRRELSPRDTRRNETDDTSTPLGVALKAMRTNTAEEIAALSGGEHLKFRDQPDLERQLSVVADDIHNRYMLSFQPNSHEPGFHSELPLSGDR